MNGVYVLHGRSEGAANFVFYCSADGVHWGPGTIVSEPLGNGKPRWACYYSNNLTVTGADGKERLLIQYSEQYEAPGTRVNVIHARVETEG